MACVVKIKGCVGHMKPVDVVKVQRSAIPQKH